MSPRLTPPPRRARSRSARLGRIRRRSTLLSSRLPGSSRRPSRHRWNPSPLRRRAPNHPIRPTAEARATAGVRVAAGRSRLRLAIGVGCLIVLAGLTVGGIKLYSSLHHEQVASADRSSTEVWNLTRGGAVVHRVTVETPIRISGHGSLPHRAVEPRESDHPRKERGVDLSGDRAREHPNTIRWTSTGSSSAGSSGSRRRSRVAPLPARATRTRWAGSWTPAPSSVSPVGERQADPGELGSPRHEPTAGIPDVAGFVDSLRFDQLGALQDTYRSGRRQGAHVGRGSRVGTHPENSISKVAGGKASRENKSDTGSNASVSGRANQPPALRPARTAGQETTRARLEAHLIWSRMATRAPPGRDGLGGEHSSQETVPVGRVSLGPSRGRIGVKPAGRHNRLDAGTAVLDHPGANLARRTTPARSTSASIHRPGAGTPSSGALAAMTSPWGPTEAAARPNMASRYPPLGLPPIVHSGLTAPSNRPGSRATSLVTSPNESRSTAAPPRPASPNSAPERSTTGNVVGCVIERHSLECVL